MVVGGNTGVDEGFTVYLFITALIERNGFCVQKNKDKNATEKAILLLFIILKVSAIISKSFGTLE